jgi:DNA topoisomerase-1
LSDDPARVAEAAGLTHVSDEVDPGWSRRRRGRGFSYVHPDGRVADACERARIEALAIPPAWTEVWISVDPRSHLQATGRDDAGRKQYRYADRWREVRDLEKFDRLAGFGERLPEVRQEVAGYLGDRGMTRRRVLAAVTALLDQTLIRIGNEEYAEDTETFGATPLRPEHVVDANGSLSLRFEGKGGTEWDLPVTDRRLRTVIRHAREGGQPDLFWYRDGGLVHDVTSSDVNEFLRELAGDDFSAKDFRTWGGTRCVTGHLGPLTPAPDPAQVEADELAAIDDAAELLGNTRTVARSSYVAPRVPDSWRSGELAEVWSASRQGRLLTRPERVTARVLAEGV